MKTPGVAQAIFAVALLAVASPVLVVCAFSVFIEDGRPLLFRQIRVGKHGKPFILLKLRTMTARSSGRAVTAAHDPRVTAAGVILRKYKLDELPQLWNIVRGEMAFIGPRPEVPAYVDLSNPAWRELLTVPPGLVDLASLTFRNEEAILSCQQDVDSYYRFTLLPRKLSMSRHYLRTRSLGRDLRLMALTVLHVFAPYHFQAPHILRMFGYEEF